MVFIKETGSKIWTFFKLKCFTFILRILFSINPFLANVPISYPPTFGFLVFSGGIKWEHWPEIGLKYSLYAALLDKADPSNEGYFVLDVPTTKLVETLSIFI